jgi:hypothetical protein
MKISEVPLQLTQWNTIRLEKLLVFMEQTMFYCYRIVYFAHTIYLGAFVKLRKVTYWLVMSMHLSVLHSSAPAGQIFI